MFLAITPAGFVNQGGHSRSDDPSHCCSGQALSIMQKPLGIHEAGDEKTVDGKPRIGISQPPTLPPFFCFHEHFVDFSFDDIFLFNSELPLRFTYISINIMGAWTISIIALFPTYTCDILGCSILGLDRIFIAIWGQDK